MSGASGRVYRASAPTRLETSAAFGDSPVRGHGPDGQVGPPVALDEGKVAAGDLARFLDDADASGLFERGVDFGSPGVTDQTSTAVTLRVGEVPGYALMPDGVPCGTTFFYKLLPQATDLG